MEKIPSEKGDGWTVQVLSPKSKSFQFIYQNFILKLQIAAKRVKEKKVQLTS